MNFNVIIIGSGPAGYSAACLCAKNNLKTAVIEQDKIGGVCLNYGCIPTKSLINIADNLNDLKTSDILNINLLEIINKAKIAEKVQNIANTVSKGIEFLFKQNKINVIQGSAKIIDSHTLQVNDIIYNADFIIIATGSSNKDLSAVTNNFQMSDQQIITSKEALFLTNTPKSILILGGGAIGVEFAYIFNSLGSQVTILEYFPQLLPNIDPEAGRLTERIFKKNNCQVITSATVTNVVTENETTAVYYQKNNQTEKINAEFILTALGRIPNTGQLGLQNLNITLENGYIKTNQWMQTNIPNIYAIGDVVANTPLLAHVAYDEARTAIDHMIKRPEPFIINYQLVPFCIYSNPQIASFGISEKEAQEKNIDFKTVKVFFKASGKAQALESTEGFIKLMINSETETIISALICGAEATELIHELILAAKAKIKIKEIADMMHAHPTLSELISEAAKSYYGLNLH